MISETLIIKRVFETGRSPGLNGCWACPLSEDEFQAALREGCTLITKTEAYGGTYTTDEISIEIGINHDEDLS